MSDKERTRRMRNTKKADKMATIITSKRSLKNFDDERFHENSIKSYSFDKNLYLIKKDLVNKPTTTTTLDQKQEENKNLLINNILELTTNDDRKLIESAINIYNNLI